MALERIDYEQLGQVLRGVITSVQNDRPITAAIMQLLYNTGLRINEVLEVERWVSNGQGGYTVQLSKREETREIESALIPDEIAEHYTQQAPYYFETYSAVSNTFKYYAPGLVIEQKKKSTLLHAFRYRYIKELHAGGMSVADIAAHMGHKVQASTAGYILAQVWLGS